MMKNKIICFYHSADMDGKCSGAIVKYTFPSTELVPFNYNKEIDWKLIDKDTVVYMVDVSASKEDMIKLKIISKEFIWIDHHISKIKELDDVDFNGLRRDGTAACILTWEYLRPNAELPDSVKYLGKYDIWNLDDDVLAFQYGIRQYNCDPNNQEFWHSVFFDIEFQDTILSDGRILYDYIITDNKLVSNSACFITKFKEYKILAVNRSHISSLFFEDHIDIDNVDILLGFAWKGKSWKFSMYTKKDDIDVSKICQEFGGGGHKKAAGIFIEKIPKELRLALFGE
jgi:nanoRNase/pAp phosphatase (c-di-AMP/oligoRNAs hydrolase)